MQPCNLIPEDQAATNIGLDVAIIRREVDSICSSEQFIASRRMVRFLRFAVDQALCGQGNQINEYLIGVEVYQRPESFDPRADNIVRVEARRLRSKLGAYYASKGREHMCLIDFPKGSYHPVFRMRSTKDHSPPFEQKNNAPWLWISAIGVALAAGVFVGWFAHSLHLF